MSSAFNNPLDNSDVPIKENKQSMVGGYFQSTEQAHQMKLYLENLELLGKFAGATGDTEIEQVVGKKQDGTDMKKKLKLRDLIPKESEFDRCRRVVIAKLNGMKDDELRVWMARFGTDNIFELSALITSYGLDKKKRDEAFESFNIWKP